MGQKEPKEPKEPKELKEPKDGCDLAEFGEVSDSESVTGTLIISEVNRLSALEALSEHMLKEIELQDETIFNCSEQGVQSSYTPSICLDFVHPPDCCSSGQSEPCSSYQKSSKGTQRSSSSCLKGAFDFRESDQFVELRDNQQTLFGTLYLTRVEVNGYV
jgi:hypothetical protein